MFQVGPGHDFDHADDETTEEGAHYQQENGPNPGDSEGKEG
jgi:hypothetical protein